MISTKEEMFALQARGLLGNNLRTWRSAIRLLESDFSGKVGIRHTKTSGDKMASLDNVPVSEIMSVIVQHQLNPHDILIQEGAPDERLIFQGEVYRSPQGLTVRWSTYKGKMRVALEKMSLHSYGVFAERLLKINMTPASYDDLMELLDNHDNGDIWNGAGNNTVVEFSVYQMPLGWSRGRNTIIWEIRNY